MAPKRKASNATAASSKKTKKDDIVQEVVQQLQPVIAQAIQEAIATQTPVTNRETLNQEDQDEDLEVLFRDADDPHLEDMNVSECRDEKHLKNMALEQQNVEKPDHTVQAAELTDDEPSSLTLSEDECSIPKQATGSPREECNPTLQAWAKSKKLKKETIEKLITEELDDLEVLKITSDEELKGLHLKTGQYALLKKAVLELRQGDSSAKPSTDTMPLETHLAESITESDVSASSMTNSAGDGHRTWLEERCIKQETIQKLYEFDFDSLEAFKLITTHDLTRMNISMGQSKLLLALVDECIHQTDNKKPADDQSCGDVRPKIPETTLMTQTGNLGDSFKTWLEDRKVTQKTIELLYELGFDSFDLIKLITKEDIAEMDITTGQKRLLTRLVEHEFGRYSPKSAKIASANAKKTASTCEIKTHAHQLTDNRDISDQQHFQERKYDRFGQQHDDSELPDDDQTVRSLEIVPFDGNSRGRNHTDNQYHRTPQRPGLFPREYRQTSRSRQLYSTFKKKARKGIENVRNYISSLGDKSTSYNVTHINGMKIVKLQLKQEYEDSRNKIRRCTIGKFELKHQQKTIMLVGATGTGKSTLIDGFCNYIFDTKWEEKNRFKLIDEHADELKNKSKGQSESQTEWITVYTITCGDSNRLPYTLNLIDTPGFADTRGITRDRALVDQIRALFENPEKYKIDCLDAVCFLAKAPDARLTKTQKYIFDSILSIFGSDIGENILVMITFADGAEAPVIEAIKAAQIPHRKAFKFNNSALFANNGKKESTSEAANNSDIEENVCHFSRMFWDMGEQSFDGFFKYLAKLDPKSLTLTKEVLQKRRNIQDTLQYLEQNVHRGLATISRLNAEQQIFQANEAKIRDNEDFTYTVTEVRSKQVECELNRHVTHCMNCHNTCHDKCKYKNDADKAKCSAMESNGRCKRCKQRCHWSDHKNSGYYLINEMVTVEKTYYEKKQEYEKASGMVASQIDVIEMVKAEYLQIQFDVEKDVKQCRDNLQRLREIALKPDPLSEVEYIEMLIQSEKEEHRLGWKDRIKELMEIKRKAERIQDVNQNKPVLPEAKNLG